MGAARTVGAYLLDTSEGLSLFDCGPTSCLPALKAGLAERGHELGDVKQLLLSHIHLDHAGAAGVLVREHPGADRLGLGDRRAAPRRPLSARAQRAAALRRHVRRALGRARAGARGERPRSRATAPPASRSSPRRAMPPTTSATSTARRSTRATRPGCGSSRAGRCCRRRRRRTSTSRAGTARSRRSSGALRSSWR